MSKQLDELVATRVMGWHKGENSRWLDSQGYSVGPLYEFSDDYYQPEDRWSPSEDIGDAWMVIEHVQALGKGWILVAPHQMGFLAWHATGCGDPDFGEYMATGETAMRAICLAALVALDVPEELRNAAFCARD